jgi:hypothetical protein
MVRRYVLGPTVNERPFADASFEVRIADDLRKATVFLGKESANDRGLSAIDARATGFFVAWQSDSTRPIHNMEPECSGIYLVTAKHVADRLGESFAIRFNIKDGGSDIDLVSNVRWSLHPDPAVDVAVFHCGYPDWSDCVPIPGRMLALPTTGDAPYSEVAPGDLIFNNPNLGIGDIAYVVGLFHLMAGKNVNLPVVHTGHIALLPGDERIPIRNGITGESHEVEGYLVEAHGLKGLSGAPVFARTSSAVTAQRYTGSVKTEYPVYGRLHGHTVLLGLWSSSWDEEPDEALAKEKRLPIGARVPIGMGVVVPATKVAETLNSEALIIARQKEYKRRLAESSATMDSLPPSDGPVSTT